MTDELRETDNGHKAEAAADFVEALAELSNPSRENTANVQTKTGGTYSYSYADLGSILTDVRPVLGRHGLALSQTIDVDEGSVAVLTRVFHRSGTTIEGGVITRAVDGTPQDLGSFITYARRYALLAFLGLHPAGEDDDGAAVSVAPSAAAPAALPDPIYDKLHLSERSIEALQAIADAPPSAKLGALAKAWLDLRVAEEASEEADS